MNVPFHRFQRVTGWLPLGILVVAMGVCPVPVSAQQGGPSDCLSCDRNSPGLYANGGMQMASTRMRFQEGADAMSGPAGIPNAGEYGPGQLANTQQPLDPNGQFGLAPLTSVADPDAPFPSAYPLDCGGACPPTWYAHANALYLRRLTTNDDGLSSGDSGELDKGYDRLAGRYTVGRIGDCLRGFELTYVGPLRWMEESHVTGALLYPRFVASGVDISSFMGAQEHHQFYQSRLDSFELNRKWWGWNVISTSFGLRYFNLHDDYQFDSLNLTNGTAGALHIATNNNLIGPQLGLDLYYPIGHWSSTFRGKAGMYANYADGGMDLTNAGVLQFANDDSKVHFAASAELAYLLSYRLTRHLTVNAGYEMWYVYGLATSPAQPPWTLTPLAGRDLKSTENLFVHGGSLGLELNW